MQNPISWDVSFPKKSTICIFVIFYNHLHQGWFLANLPPYPHPMGHPTRPTTHLPSFMFFVSNKSKKDAWSWKFNCFCDFSKWWVGLQFWPFWPFLANFKWAGQSEGGTKMPNDGFSLLYTWYTVPKHPWSMLNQFYAILEHANSASTTSSNQLSAVWQLVVNAMNGSKMTS